MSLLDRARKILHIKAPQRTDIPDDEKIKLAFAWLKREVTSTQVNLALGKKSNGSGLYNMASWLRLAYEKGQLKIKETK
jgi:hypothetical protein